jgi:hypothetical protein
VQKLIIDQAWIKLRIELRQGLDLAEIYSQLRCCRAKFGLRLSKDQGNIELRLKAHTIEVELRSKQRCVLYSVNIDLILN